MVRILPSRLKPHNGSSSAPNSRSNSPMRSKGDGTGAATPKDSGLALKVAVIRARNLAAKDRGGTSDPYLVLTLGEAKEMTHSVPKSLDPEWNVVCQMPITGVQSLLLDVTCWDKDRFGKDYMGGFELALEDIFANEKTEQEPKWYPLKSKRPKKKKSVVSGEVLLQFTLLDTTNNQATQKEIFDKFRAIVGADGESWSRNATPTATPLTAPAASSGAGGTLGPAAAAGRRRRGSPPLSNTDADEETPLDEEDEIETPPEEGAEAASKPESAEKRRRRRRLRVKGLKKRKRQGAFAFNNDSDVVGIIYLEIVSIKDLPPESNLTRTSFDMDPFVVTSLGKRTFRTKVVRHNLNPVFNEKMIFQVLNHEQSYSIAFTVIDHDTYSNNDFIASASLSVADLVDRAPKANPETGLFELREPPEYSPPAAAQRSRFRLPMSRSASSQSLNKAGNGNGSRPVPAKNSSASVVPSAAAVAAAIATPGAMSQQAAGAAGLQSSGAEQGADVTQQAQVQAPLPSPGAVGSQGQLAAGGDAAGPSQAAPGVPAVNEASDEDPDFTTFSIPLKMKNTEKWEDKHNPVLYVRAKYMPYPALRQQFWRAMLKQYDTDESGRISKVELTTMLDTLGSTLRESTIDSFFKRFPHKVAGAGGEFDCDLTMDEAVICLEDQLDARNRQQQSAGAAMVDRVRGMLPDADRVRNMLSVPQKGPASGTTATPTLTSESTLVSTSAPTLDASTSTIVVPELQSPGEEGEVLDRADDLNVDKSEEHVVEIRECPICHQPRLNKRKDADIITHVATCASSDWRQVNNLVMAGFVTASQAQRKWYSKVITKISYGGYRLGANSANILVQDRITGQISEEKMSVYVRLGIRLLYKGLKSNNMENKRIRKLLKGLSIKQGKKFDDPASRAEIQKFIEFHQLDMSEVLLPVEEFKNFNEFFYRALKPGARPPSAPENPRIAVSPADCRSVVFNRIEAATRIWIKGREFSVRRLLGDKYTEDAPRFENGALGIFRLAPQDYHRFHIPVDGVMGTPKTIAGEYYTVNPMAIRSALDVYGENVRVLVPIDSPEFGRVMVICVGAMMVGSTVITRREGEQVRRGEELGYFKFGGSTIVLLFEEGKILFDDDLVDNSNGALETLIRAGMSIGHHPSEPQWRRDMRKESSQITAADKQDALRRIQGSVDEEDGVDSSSSPSDNAPPAGGVTGGAAARTGEDEEDPSTSTSSSSDDHPSPAAEERPPPIIVAPSGAGGSSQ